MLIHPGDRVRLVPGSPTSLGVAGNHDVGVFIARLGTSLLCSVRIDGSSGPLYLVAEMRHLSRVPDSLADSIEVEARLAFGDR